MVDKLNCESSTKNNFKFPVLLETQGLNMGLCINLLQKYIPEH